MSKPQKNVPIPPAKVGRARIYQFDKIKVGESIYLPNRSVSQVNSAYQQYRKKDPSYKLIMRSEDSGCRIWRVSKLKPKS